jgi:hypothetical protein
MFMSFRTGLCGKVSYVEIKGRHELLHKKPIIPLASIMTPSGASPPDWAELRIEGFLRSSAEIHLRYDEGPDRDRRGSSHGRATYTEPTTQPLKRC